MELYQSISVIGDFFRLTHVENPGAAFSIGFDSPYVNRIFFSILTFLMIFFILFLLKQSKSFLEKLSFSFVLGGAIGNLIDRLIFGAVTDFFDFDFINIFGLDRWPVFNIADSSIVVGVFILLYHTIFFEIRDVKKENLSNDMPVPEKKDDFETDTNVEEEDCFESGETDKENKENNETDS